MELLVKNSGNLPLPESILANTLWAKALQKTAKMTDVEIKQLKLEAENERIGKNLPDQSGYKSKLVEIYDCPICKNKLRIMSYAGEELVAADCKCLAIRKSKLAALNSGLGALLDKRINDFKTPEQWHKDFKSVAVQFMQNNGRGFAALGQSGSGKTHICAAICNHYLGQGKKIYYFNWLREVRKLGALKFDYEAYNKILSDCEKSDVLYIDDLLKTRDGDIPTATEIKIAREIVDIAENKTDGTLIISSEYLLNNLVEIDSSLAGRIKEMCGEYMVCIEKTELNNYRWKL